MYETKKKWLTRSDGNLEHHFFFFMPHFIRFKGCIKTTFRLNLLCFCMLNILFWYLMFGITHLKCS